MKIALLDWFPNYICCMRSRQHRGEKKLPAVLSCGRRGRGRNRQHISKQRSLLVLWTGALYPRCWAQTSPSSVFECFCHHLKNCVWKSCMTLDDLTCSRTQSRTTCFWLSSPGSSCKGQLRHTFPILSSPGYELLWSGQGGLLL